MSNVLLLLLLLVFRVQLLARSDLAPSEETPMLVHTPGQGQLLPDLGAHGLDQTDLGQVSLDGRDLASGGEGSDVDHEDLALGQLLDLGPLLVPFDPDAQQAPEEEERDLQVGQDVGEGADRPEDLACHPVASAEGGVDLGADADEAAGDGEGQVVLLSVEGDHAGEDGLTHHRTLRVFADDSRPDLQIS